MFAYKGLRLAATVVIISATFPTRAHYSTSEVAILVGVGAIGAALPAIVQTYREQNGQSEVVWGAQFAIEPTYGTKKTDWYFYHRLSIQWQINNQGTIRAKYIPFLRLSQRTAIGLGFGYARNAMMGSDGGFSYGGYFEYSISDTEGHATLNLSTIRDSIGAQESLSFLAGFHLRFLSF